MSNSAIKAAYLVLTPISPGSAPNGVVFFDNTNGNALSQKDLAGNVSVLAVSPSINPFQRQVVAGEAFPINRPLAVRADGKFVMADSDDVAKRKFVGYSTQASFGDGSIVGAVMLAPVLSNAVSGLGFAPGDDVFLGETPGEYINDPSTLTGGDDDIIKVGIALPLAAEASSSAADLLIFSDVILRN